VKADLPLVKWMMGFVSAFQVAIFAEMFHALTTTGGGSGFAARLAGLGPAHPAIRRNQMHPVRHSP
jgi:hypothetical protein